MVQTFEAVRADAAARVAGIFEAELAGNDRLHAAMRHAVSGNGKYLRPALCVAAAGLFDAPDAQVSRVAAAIEAVHCYALAHDDLPSMDNDDMRRGRAALHVAFDEATAILAGNALLTLGFALLADAETGAPPALIAGLAQAVGARGMLGGQMADMADDAADEAALARRHDMKTGALLVFAVEAGAILGGADDDARDALTDYARDIGLAFQIADDILDVAGKSETLGKTVGKDAASGKATFATLLGVDEARARAQSLVARAVGRLDAFGTPAEPLRQAAAFVIARDS